MGGKTGTPSFILTKWPLEQANGHSFGVQQITQEMYFHSIRRMICWVSRFCPMVRDARLGSTVSFRQACKILVFFAAAFGRPWHA